MDPGSGCLGQGVGVRAGEGVREFETGNCWEVVFASICGEPELNTLGSSPGLFFSQAFQRVSVGQRWSLRS